MPDHSAAAKDCPLPSPTEDSVYARTLHRACLVLGGADRLARHLDVEERVLLHWLKGEGRPTEAAFLACVEVVLLHAESLGRPN